MFSQKLKTISSVYFVFILIPVLFSFFVSCKDDAVTTGPQASVNLKADSSITDAADTIIYVDSAKFLIETVKLHRANDSSSVKVGPFRVYINLNGTLTEWGIAGIPAGTYDKVSFKIHKYNPGEPLPDNDSDFVNTIGPVGYSAIIGGTYNGANFVYRSPKSAHQKVDIDPPLVIPENTDAVYNATLVVEWKRWFLRNGYWMDPRDPDNENDIDNNIKDSFNKAFKDIDKNGIPDS